MRKINAHSLVILLISLFALAPAWATCGGGGGGGVGGMSGGRGGESNAPVYTVPWKVRGPKDPAPMGLVLYWLPLSDNELHRSSLRESRTLSLYATQCISMELIDYRTPEGQKLIGDSKPPAAVLTKPDGTVIGKAENKNNFLKVEQVEKLVEGQVKQLESGLDATLKDAKAKAAAGDNTAAIKLYQSVLSEKCMFPKKAKEAAKELKRLGVEIAAIPDGPVFEKSQSARIEQTMRKGLRAEMNARYVEAERLYSLAHRMDPADPTPLRFLGELYRHHIGNWDKARTTFEGILKMPADPLATAIALHGLGKMTIHDGDFRKGLALMEQSVDVFPTALAYRNLAVYWNSEGDQAKAGEYTQKALGLDPRDPYNLVFAAVFVAASGRVDEALRIARENANLLPASYNLAAIYAQAGQRDKALSLLQRHFFQYERYQAVRAKEMMEARVDAVFDSLRSDASFIALTRGADGKLPLPMKN